MTPEELDKLFKDKLEANNTPLPAGLWSRLEEKMQEKPLQEPVDDFFRTRLNNYEPAMPPALWNKLEQRMQGGSEEKVRPLWMWYAAACIALLLSVAGLWQFNRQATSGTEIALQQPAQTIEQPNTDTTTPAPAAIENTATAAPEQSVKQEAVVNTEAPANTATGRSEVQKANPVGAKRTPPAANRPKRSESVLPAQEAPQLAQAQPVEAGRNDQPPVSATPEQPKQQSQLAQAEPQRYNQVTVDLIMTSEPAAESPVDMGQEQPREHIAKRVAKQLWNIKKGEKPNLQELGLASSYTMQVQAKQHTLTKTINL